MELNYKKVESFLKAPVPQDIEDEILGAYATYNLERDMRSEDLRNYFESLQLPRELYKMVGKSDLTVEGTDVVDFERLLRCTYHYWCSWIMNRLLMKCGGCWFKPVAEIRVSPTLS